MKALPSLRIAIVGCGTAGPAAAVFLARQGHRVELFERAETCRPVGAGFLLQPSGMAVLRDLGLLETVLEKAAKIRRMHVVHSGGGTLMDLRYADLGETCHGAGLHRPVLLAALIEGMEAAGAALRWGAEIVSAKRVPTDASSRDSERASFASEAAAPRASAASGRGGTSATWTLETATGERYGGYDLLLVADGARSHLRRLAGSGVDRGYPWGAHWFIGRNDGSFPEDELFQIVRGTSTLCGFLATGSGPDSTERLVSLFWSVRLADDASWRQRPLQEWKDAILEVCPAAEGLLSQIASWDDVLLARYGDVRMRRWHGDGIAVLGDAGHAMSPQLGQGVNLALADAACLARCLSEMPAERALRAYTRRRRLNLAYYQLATRWLTPWFQSDLEWLSPSRRFFFRAAGFVAPARRFMVKTMAGEVFCRQSWRGEPRQPPPR